MHKLRAYGLMLFFVVIAAMVPVSAAPITFTFTGVGTGNLSGTAFTDSQFAVTGVGDTSNIQSCGAGCFFLDFSSASFSGAFGSGTILDGTRVFNLSSSGVAGLSRAGVSGSDLIDFSNPALVGFLLDTSIGPITGQNIFAVNQFNNLGTSAGPLTFTQVSTISFEASTASQVPEPGTIALLATGLIGLAGNRFRRHI